MSPTQNHDIRISSSPLQRVLLALVSAPLLAFSMRGTWLYFSHLKLPTSFADAVISGIVGQFILTLLIVSALSQLWALATPRWVALLLERYAVKLIVATCWFVPAVLVGVWLFA